MAGKSGKRERSRQAPTASFKNEVTLWAVLAVSIILFISNFGIAGGVGRFLSGLIFGLFGIAAYIFPLALFAGTAFFISNQDNPVAAVKTAASALFFLFLCMFLELITGSAKSASPIDSFLWSRKGKGGGGLFGGLLTWLIRPHLGTVSAYIINIIALIICLVLITQRSILKPIGSGGKKAYRMAKDKAKEEVALQQQKYVEHRQRRMDNKVLGVSMDTSMKGLANQPKPDAVSELHVMPDFPIHMMDEPRPKPQEKRMAEPIAFPVVLQGAKPPSGAPIMQDMPETSSAPTMQEAQGMSGAPTIREASAMSSAQELPEDEISVVSQKVVLKPSMPSAADKADDILEKTSELFSEMLPKMNSGTKELEDSDWEESVPFAPQGGKLNEEADSNEERLEASRFSDESLEIAGLKTAGLEAAGTEFTDAEATGLKETDSDITASEENLNARGFDEYEYEDTDEADEELDYAALDEIDMQSPQAEMKRPQADMQRLQADIPKPQASAQNAPANLPQVKKQVIKREHVYPTVDLLKAGDPNKTGDSRQHLQETAMKLQQTLKNFGVNVTILNVSCGPSVTRYEIQPEMGVKVSKIVNLADDIKLNLAAADIRIEAPIPGKAAIGIEVPNKENVPVMFRSLVDSEEFKQFDSPCTFAVGKDITGKVVVTDICKMPHLLIAGATGSGKSVCINTIIMSILYKADPEDVKLIMVDPKVVELNVYNGIPHLLLPVVTDPKKAAGALHWAVSEMMERYNKFAASGVRGIKGYNAKIKKLADVEDENKPQKMPYIVIIVDELADLMMAAPGDVEDAICRLAQLARAAGIHLIIATQRPSVNVITGLIKANMPSRIAFSVTSGTDSRTILDMNGAEKLLGKGDMLFYPQGYQKPVRVQGAFVSDSEVTSVVEFLTEQNDATQYSQEIEDKVTSAASAGMVSIESAPEDDRDVYFADAAKLLIEKEKASVSMLQRYFKIGFNRAARIMDQLEEAGVVGAEEGTKPRKILMSSEEFAQYEEEVL